jgi:hypothetical protein
MLAFGLLMGNHDGFSVGTAQRREGETWWSGKK